MQWWYRPLQCLSISLTSHLIGILLKGIIWLFPVDAAALIILAVLASVAIAWTYWYYREGKPFRHKIFVVICITSLVWGVVL